MKANGQSTYAKWWFRTLNWNLVNDLANRFVNGFYAGVICLLRKVARFVDTMDRPETMQQKSQILATRIEQWLNGSSIASTWQLYYLALCWSHCIRTTKINNVFFLLNAACSQHHSKIIWFDCIHLSAFQFAPQPMFECMRMVFVVCQPKHNKGKSRISP